MLAYIKYEHFKEQQYFEIFLSCDEFLCLATLRILQLGHFRVNSLFFPVSCHLGPKGPNGKIVLIRFVHVHKKYKTRVGDRQRKSGYCGILAQKVYVRTYARINYAPLSNLTMYTTVF